MWHVQALPVLRTHFLVLQLHLRVLRSPFPIAASERRAQSAVRAHAHVAPAVGSRNQPVAAERVLPGADRTSNADLDRIHPCEDQQRSRDEPEGAARAQF